MLECQKEESTEVLEKVIAFLEGAGFGNIRASIDGYEDPKSYHQTRIDVHISPDVVAEKDGKTYLFDIALKTDDVRQVKGRWLFFKTLAGMRNYAFQVFMPKGSVSFARSVIASMDEPIKAVKI